MHTNTIQQVPELLCTLLSPYTSHQTTANLLDYLTHNPSLLDAVITCANQQMVITTLYAQLQANQQQLLPKDLWSYMAAMHHYQSTRNQRIQYQANSLIARFQQQGINTLLLKGVNTLYYDLYPSIGARFMVDVDILVTAADIPKAQAIMQQYGYAIPEHYHDIQQGTKTHHLLPHYKAGHDCALELHFKPLNKESGELLTTDAVFQASHPVNNNDSQWVKTVRTLSPEHKIIHAFAHSEISHRNQQHDKLDIRQICLLYTSPSPRDGLLSRMPSSA